MRRAFLIAAVFLASGTAIAQYGSTAASMIRPTVTFAQLSAISNPQPMYARNCSDCTQASPCASGGTGALALYINGGWSCTAGGTATGNPFSDATALVKNSVDPTKLLRFDMTGASPSTTYTVSYSGGLVFPSQIVVGSLGGDNLAITPTNLQFDAASGSGNINILGYTDGVGPFAFDGGTGFRWTLNISGLSANRAPIAPNHGGTIAVGNTGTCTLNGAATAQCTATVTAATICVASYVSDSAPHTVSVSLSGTTLTITSATTLDGGNVNFHCY